jgi:hypothetical protein
LPDVIGPYFHTKKFNLGIFSRTLKWKKYIVYFSYIWKILRPFGRCCGRLEYLTPFWYVVPRKNLASVVLVVSLSLKIASSDPPTSTFSFAVLGRFESPLQEPPGRVEWRALLVSEAGF